MTSATDGSRMPTQFDSVYDQGDEGSQYGFETEDIARASRREMMSRIWRNIKKPFKFVFVLIVVLTVVFTVLTFIRVDDASRGELMSDIAYDRIGNYFPSLVLTEEGLAVRLGSGECESDYDRRCEELDSLYCTEKGALRTFEGSHGGYEERSGISICVCDGQKWLCGLTGKFCTTNPSIPSGAVTWPLGEDCINTASSQTCSFSCGDNLMPSGDFTCTNGNWDIQHCVCSAESLESELSNSDIFGVISTESCDATNVGKECSSWQCEGNLIRASYQPEVKCEAKGGWTVSQNTFCVCQTDRLFATLAANGIDYVDVTGCKDTPAGGVCDAYDWECPYNLIKNQAEFECSEKNGVWSLPYSPLCVCNANDDSTEIDGFESGCDYISVGQSCTERDWECEDDLVPITPLECTSHGWTGECGCSSEELDKALLATSQNEQVVSSSECDETPIGEECTKWDCGSYLKKACCNSPVCKEDGSWEVQENMCQGCDPTLLESYGLLLLGMGDLCAAELVGVGHACSITCLPPDVMGESPFICPGRLAPCSATCLDDGSWDIPCVCNENTLSWKIPYAEINPPTECSIGDHCENVNCTSQFLEVIQTVICDPWIGYVGECGCLPLDDPVYNGRFEEIFPPGTCKGYELSDICEDVFCPNATSDSRTVVLCTGNDGWVKGGVNVPSQGESLCDTSIQCLAGTAGCACPFNNSAGALCEPLCSDPSNSACATQILYVTRGGGSTPTSSNFGWSFMKSAQSDDSIFWIFFNNAIPGNIYNMAPPYTPTLMAPTPPNLMLTFADINSIWMVVLFGIDPMSDNIPFFNVYSFPGSMGNPYTSRWDLKFDGDLSGFMAGDSVYFYYGLDSASSYPGIPHLLLTSTGDDNGPRNPNESIGTIVASTRTGLSEPVSFFISELGYGIVGVGNGIFSLQ